MPKFKNKKEWETFVDQGLASGKTPQEMNSLAGVYEGPEGKFAVHKAKDSKRGWTPVDKNLRKERDARRAAEGKKQDALLLETLKLGGVSDVEAKGILKQEKDGYKRIEDKAKELNEVHGKGAFNAGHETAAIQGGGNYESNARVEIGKSRVRADGSIMRGNQSRGRLDETPDYLKPAMGIPRSHRGGQDTALYHLLTRDVPGIMDLGLTPYDRQEIKRNPDNANDIIAQRQEQLSQPKPTKKPFEPPPVQASTKLRLDPKAQTTAPTPKPQVNPKPTGYVHRNKGPSETPPVTTGGNPITEFLGSPQVTKGLQQVIGGGAAVLTVLGSGLKSLFVGSGI